MAVIDTAGVPREIPDREEPEAPPPSDAGAAAVERLFESHAERLRRYVFRYVRSWEVAQDLVHDLFLRLWDRREDLGRVADLDAYLYAGARNRALTWLRQRRIEEQWREREASVVAGDEAAARPGRDDPVQQLLAAEIAAAVQQAVDALPSRQRQVLLLQWSGRSYEQIAAALAISPKTVSVHLTRAVEHLRRTLPRLVG